jgi:hypothetical protein
MSGGHSLQAVASPGTPFVNCLSNLSLSPAECTITTRVYGFDDVVETAPVVYETFAQFCTGHDPNNSYVSDYNTMNGTALIDPL